MVDRKNARIAGRRDVGGGRGKALLVIVVWVLLIGGFQLYARQQQLSARELFESLIQVCRVSPAGPLMFLAAAALSPLLLVPAALLGGGAGVCFGPALGIAYTLVGCNISATVTYLVGRFSRRGMPETGKLRRTIDRYGPRLRRNAFWGVMLLRLSFLPYDAINYLVGLLCVRWPVFIVANTLGSLPGVIAIVLAGASVQSASGFVLPAGPLILISGAMLLFSAAVAAALWFRERQAA